MICLTLEAHFSTTNLTTSASHGVPLTITLNNTGLFWMQTNVRHRDSGEQGLAILRYSNYKPSAKTPLRKPRSWPPRDDIDWSLRHARRFKARFPVALPEATRRLSFLGSQLETGDDRLVWSINNITFETPSTPILHSMALDLKSETRKWVEQNQIPAPYDYNLTTDEAGFPRITNSGTQVIRLRKDEVVDIVFQNTRALNGAEEIHPW